MNVQTSQVPLVDYRNHCASYPFHILVFEGGVDSNNTTGPGLPPPDSSRQPVGGVGIMADINHHPRLLLQDFIATRQRQPGDNLLNGTGRQFRRQLSDSNDCCGQTVDGKPVVWKQYPVAVARLLQPKTASWCYAWVARHQLIRLSRPFQLDRLGGRLLQYRLRWIAIGVDSGYAGAKDARFLKTDDLTVVSEKGNVIDINGGNNGQIRIQNVDRIQAPAQPNFKNPVLDTRFQEQYKSSEGSKLEIR